MMRILFFALFLPVFSGLASAKAAVITNNLPNKLKKIEIKFECPGNKPIAGQQVALSLVVYPKIGSPGKVNQSKYRDYLWEEFDFTFQGAKPAGASMTESNGWISIDDNAAAVVVNVVARNKAQNAASITIPVARVEQLFVRNHSQVGNIILFDVAGSFSDGQTFSVSDKTFDPQLLDYSSSAGTVYLDEGRSRLYVELPADLTKVHTSGIELTVSLVKSDLTTVKTIPFDFGMNYDLNLSGKSGSRGEQGETGSINQNKSQHGTNGGFGEKGGDGKSAQIYVDLVEVDFHTTALLYIKIVVEGEFYRAFYLDPAVASSAVLVVSNGGSGGDGGNGGRGEAYVPYGADDALKCGNGGDGGMGGAGGSGGSLTLIMTNRAKVHQNKFTLTAAAGKAGYGGFGGSKSHTGSCVELTQDGKKGVDGNNGGEGQVYSKFVNDLNQ